MGEFYSENTCLRFQLMVLFFQIQLTENTGMCLWSLPHEVSDNSRPSGQKFL